MPKVFGDTMDFYVIRQLLDLKKGAFGILEPQADEKNLLTIGAYAWFRDWDLMPQAAGSAMARAIMTDIYRHFRG